MPVFKYLAKASPTEFVQGEMQAESEDALAGQLTELGLYPVDISAILEEQILGGKRLSVGNSGATRKALISFTRQLANMMEAGMTVYSALHLLQSQTKEASLKQVLQDVLRRLQDGQQLSEACAAWPKLFSPLYVNMLRAGETGGMVQLVLMHLADYLEGEDDVKKQIRAAMAYPLLMLGMGIITLVLLLTFVVPNIVQMFDEINQTLPWPTRVLISVSDFVVHNGFVLAVVVTLLVFGFKMNLANRAFREKLDGFKLRLPFFGSLIVEGEVAQFARTLSALLGHGVPVDKAFDVVVASCNNSIVKREFCQTAETIRKGGRIGASLLSSTVLPPLLGQMITTAEFTNQLQTALDRIAKSSAREVERRVALFTKLLEPGMIIILGVIIGFIVFAMMMPIFQMDFMVQ
ncbi:MAG: type II secretion system F family protein [bacterium]